jgi:GPH family glycoside/pentoside/hexuronide:cation symporter
MDADLPQGARSAKARLGLLALASYALPGAGFAFYLFFIQFYFLKYATDVLLAAPAVIGGLIGAGRIWDAFSDPLVGHWSDRTHSRLGRRRPWMLAGIPLLGATFLMVWMPPDALEGTALTVWSAVALFGFYTAFTLYTVPHQSLGAELSLDHHERSRVFGSYRAAFVAGMMVSFVAIGAVEAADAPRDAAQRVALAAVGVASLLLLGAPVLLRERVEHRGRGGATPTSALRDVGRNPHARLLLVAWFVDALGGGVLGVLSPFMTEYVLDVPEAIAYVPAFFVVSSVLSIPVWLRVSRRWGKRRAWRSALVLSGLSFGATIFVGPGDVALLCGLLVGAGVASGCGGVIAPSLLADTIDWDELASGQRKEGAYSAAFGFVQKLGIGVVVMLAGLALQAVGFAPNVGQTPAVRETIQWMFAGGPLVGALLASAVLGWLTLDEAEHRRIRAALDARAAAG